MNWAKSQTGEISYNPEKILLLAIVQEVVHTLDSAASIKNISINYSQINKVEVYGDKNMLKSVIHNLISNSIKFTKLGGKIDILSKSLKKDVEIIVSDNGVGMSEETLKKIFCLDANYTSKGTENEKGSGLGLSLCKDFVEKHGGKIWVESEQGRGSDFIVMLPKKIEKETEEHTLTI